MNKGFAGVIIIVGVLVLTVLGGGAYYFGKLPIKPSGSQPKACTMEAKICPDGSSVGRTGPNCEFTACPIDNPQATDETANWKTYKNDGMGFELRYPDFLYPGLEKQDRVNFGGQGVPIPYLTITISELLDYNNLPLKKCLKYQGEDVEYCLEKGSSWKQKEDISNTKLDRINAKSFYISDFICKYHVVQTLSSPLIELRMCVSREISDDIFNQILSTFKFTD